MSGINARPAAKRPSESEASTKLKPRFPVFQTALGSIRTGR
ncbi:hypothetical protein HMPREF9123_0531 [Neisseria bacilliformis ATCC BAA-1200]|uniref:Uncharacterized protein n=1 Tax=Neisseria bacilliformis ATCC BAA-1200 TaxID=888742 RepID=F2BA02_9NEIS|nr:hypothetical protein HMPREF9123_0531 [Neisseria bacilliformis ATCC BAA-1200]